MSTFFDDKRPSKVLEYLFIGSRAHAKNRGMLKELGINRILNVTPPKTMDPSNGVSNFFEKDKSMTYKRVPVFDNRGEDLLQHFAACISFIEQGSFYGKVLVHCSKGVSRSSTVCAAYLMSTRGLTKDAALAYLRSRRPIVNPHEGFTAQLDTFEARLKREWDAAIADGQPPKFPEDLLESNKRAKGPAIGPSIGPSRGPSPPITSQNATSRSPARGPSSRHPIGPSESPPRNSLPSGGSAITNSAPTKMRPKSPARDNPGVAIGPPRGPPSSLPSINNAQVNTGELGQHSSGSGLVAGADQNGTGEGRGATTSEARGVSPGGGGEKLGTGGGSDGKRAARGGLQLKSDPDAEDLSPTNGLKSQLAGAHELDGEEKTGVIRPIGPLMASIGPAISPCGATEAIDDVEETKPQLDASKGVLREEGNVEGAQKRLRKEKGRGGELKGGEKQEGGGRSVKPRVEER